MARDLLHSYLLLKREAYHGSPNCKSIETKYIAPTKVGKGMFWIKLFRLDQFAYLNQQPYVIFYDERVSKLGRQKDI